ncbi:MAG: dTDP-4-dehydrorhamnose 3,5-epimerase family protein [archaeon]|nr:dTDP-4-dehydrorhamnose 3,5-epimerase family protein [archaeon]
MKMIFGVMVKKLSQIKDERGFLMEMLRSDWKEFEKFGQVYLTVCKAGYAKAWHYHKKQTDHFVCVKNNARIVLYDNREGSFTRGLLNEFVIGEKNPLLVKIPPLVLHGFRAEGKKDACIVNIPTELYNYEKPDEFRIPFNDALVPYDWKVKKGF